VKASRIFWSLVVSGAVVLGGAAWLSAHRLPAQDRPVATGEASSAELTARHSAPGARQQATETSRAADRSAIAAAARAATAAVPPATETARPNSAPAAADVSRPSEASIADTDGIEAPVRRARPKAAPRVNPVSGELMWSARDVIPADGGRPDEPLCGGKVCAAGQFCCGPPECGRCAYPMAGPRCPSVCPAQKSN
jgi:hypothetical protein